MPYSRVGATNIATGVTAVECQKQVRSWRLLRYLIHLLVPSCNGTTFIEEKENYDNNIHNHFHPKPVCTTSANAVTGTMFGYRRGKMRFCIQTHSKSTIPVLLLELAVSTRILAKEMQGGILRIALECTSFGYGDDESLMSTPEWTMYCNGRKVGYAVKRKISKADMHVLRLMDLVVAGAGVINGKALDQDHDNELMYFRANFKRVRDSSNSESYHLIDPDGNINGRQELSVFFFHSG
ncbi:hypothetical protein Pint_27637 [Pistacia integerrima]|uniref:Uncharacterized protein n=1 Tax=Pistacia integerrima TaxID=434235 RepID=A0ACC0YQI9_9ROSI|nr:hypothetical protein Pint_27637 [Pistacia integerrima]